MLRSWCIRERTIDVGYLSTWKEGGRLPLSFYPGQVGNLILLCASCHGGYDSRDTTWFMLPADLKFFNKYEENDYNERKAAASQGIKRPRTTPELEDVFCQPYFGDADFVRHLSRFLKSSNFPKPFNGCIQAMMWKASASVFAFPELETSGDDSIQLGIPCDVRADASTLLGLYARKDPVVEPSKKDNSGKPSPPDAEDKDPKPREGRPPTNDKDPEKAGKGKRRNSTKAHHQGATQENNFCWGPEMTAAKAMDVVSGWHRSNERYKRDRYRREKMLAERKRMLTERKRMSLKA